jgi:hypothetical protein
MKSTLILAPAALAATSCSLQLDSQYGLRWDRSIPAQRHHESEPKHTETIAAATKVSDEFQSTTDWTEATVSHVAAAQFSDQIQLTTERPESVNDVFTDEAQGADNTPETSVADFSVDANQHVTSEKDVLTKFGGIILLLLGIGLLWLSFFAIVVMGAYGASFGGVLFAILVTVLGILLIILGRRLYRNY